MASAQLYWGRIAAILIRILYAFFPQIDWGFVYVDDFALLIRSKWAALVGWTAMVLLTVLGCPFSWHKVSLALRNTWLGISIRPSPPLALLPEEKLTLMVGYMNDLIQGTFHTHNHIQSMLGRLVWATQVCPHAKPFLQPLFAWKAMAHRGAYPGPRQKMMAALIRTFIRHPFTPPHPRPTPTAFSGASDASAAQSGRVGIGGWLSDSPTSKWDVWWYAAEINPRLFPAFFEDPTKPPSQHIAAWELLGSMYLFKYILAMVPQNHLHEVYVPGVTDNQGNTYSILNMKTKVWPAAAFVMELAWFTHKTGAQVGIVHRKRTLNTWADALAGGDHRGFDPGKRIPCQPCPDDWDLLPSILQSDPGSGKHGA